MMLAAAMTTPVTNAAMQDSSKSSLMTLPIISPLCVPSPLASAEVAADVEWSDAIEAPFRRLREPRDLGRSRLCTRRSRD